jgi:hypothetical protein
MDARGHIGGRPRVVGAAGRPEVEAEIGEGAKMPVGTLYDAVGNVLCAPDGGIDGRGDGQCADFRSQRTGGSRVWEDPRTR